MQSTDPLIRIRDLLYRYPGSARDVLRIPSLDVSGSGLIALTGPSGVGKTTLVELLAGTLREPYEGSVRVLGKEWSSLTKDAERQRHLRRIGLIPQDYGLLPAWSPAQTLEQDLADVGVPKNQRRGRTDRALRQVDLEEFRDRRIGGLSGGQRQRVAIARMLARDVDLVIADEPTANLDAELVSETVALLRRLADHVPVLVVTHDPRVGEMFDRTIVLQSAADVGALPTGGERYRERSDARPRRRFGLLALAIVVSLGALTASMVALLSRRGSNTATPLAAPALTSNASTDHPGSSTPSAPAPSFASLFAQESSGVIRIEATSCGQSDIGTGFLIRPDLIATVNHVVAEPVSIALSQGAATTTGIVVGLDPSNDLALIRAGQPFPGHVFSLASSAPRVGDSVAAFGYPENLPLTFTQGTVSGLDRTITIEELTLIGLIQTDTAVNPGNSGGPLIDASGLVTGLVDAKRVRAEGIAYAIKAASAVPSFSLWEQNETPQPPADCSTPTGPSGAGDIPFVPSDPDAAAMAQTIATFHNAINAGDYFTAWEQYTPAEQQSVTVGHLATADATSFGFDVRIHQVTRIGSDESIVYATFTSVQAAAYGPNGDTCDNWTLDYTMRLIGFRWLIDHADAHNGSTHSAC